MAIRERGSATSEDVGGKPASPRYDEVRRRLMTPVDASSIAVFRIGFGVITAWGAWRFFQGGFIDHYIEGNYLFRWWGFSWVHPHGSAFYVLLVVLGLAGLAAMVGAWYRVSATLVFLATTYLFLIDQAKYLNHVYLECIVALVMIIVPAHATWSVDARRKPWVRSREVPAWSVWLLRFQVGVPYFFAGVAKLNYDWLIRNEPLGEWLLRRTDFPVIGPYFSNDITVRIMAESSTALDLSVPFLLLHRRTRAPAFGFALGFHLMNSRLFSIGVFPWMMILVTTIFFDYDWPKRMWATLRRGNRVARGAIIAAALVGTFLGGWLPRYQLSPVMMSVTAFGMAFFVFHMLPERLRLPAEDPPDLGRTPWRQYTFTKALAVFLVVWMALQLLVPLRHFVIPGNVHWTDEGHRFSWHMLLRQKMGWAIFHIRDPKTGETWTEDLTRHLSHEQVGDMAVRPDMLLQFAHYLDGYYQDLGWEDVEVRVETQAWLNSRIPQPFIDPEVDLSEVRRPLIGPAPWIIPLEPYSE